jgi:hypothetical protein
MCFPNRGRINTDPRRLQVMRRRKQVLSAILVLWLLFAPAAETALAQRPADQTIGATHGQIAGAIAGIAAGGALIGVGVYAEVKHNHGVTGCVRSGPDGLELTSESDKKTYTLTGDVAGIKSGNRVRVSGKKSRDKSAGTSQFLVEKVSKELGPCEAGSQVR